MSGRAFLIAVFSLALLFPLTPSPAAEIADAQLARARKGEPVDEDAMERSFHEWDERHRTFTSLQYLTQVKWSLIDPENHGGWPYRSETLMEYPRLLFNVLSKMAKETGDPVVHYALVFPALSLKDDRESRAQIAWLHDHDEFLYKRIRDIFPLAMNALDRAKEDYAQDKKKREAPVNEIIRAKPRLPMEIRRFPVQILSAIYGTGGKDADVTDRVRNFIEVEPRAFSANPEDLGRDPFPGRNKGFHVVYMKDGVRREQHRNENERILPESFYGPQDANDLQAWLPGSRWAGEQPELQFHPGGVCTVLGTPTPLTWEATAPNKVRIVWAPDKSLEYRFDYTWSAFSQSDDPSKIYHLVKE